jgi:hypothetical protein
MKTRLLAALEDLDRGNCMDARRNVLEALALMPVGLECEMCGAEVEADGLCHACLQREARPLQFGDKLVVSPSLLGRKSRLTRLSEIAASIWAVIWSALYS